MPYKKCAICKRSIDEATRIVSRKNQLNTLNYYYFDSAVVSNPQLHKHLTLWLIIKQNEVVFIYSILIIRSNCNNYDIIRSIKKK